MILATLNFRNKSKSRLTESCQNGSSSSSRQSETIPDSQPALIPGGIQFNSIWLINLILCCQNRLFDWKQELKLKTPICWYDHFNCCHSLSYSDFSYTIHVLLKTIKICFRTPSLVSSKPNSWLIVCKVKDLSRNIQMSDRTQKVFRWQASLRCHKPRNTMPHWWTQLLRHGRYIYKTFINEILYGLLNTCTQY